MEYYEFPPPIRRESRGIFHWPLSIAFELNTTGMMLLDVLFYCGYSFYREHDIIIKWHGWKGNKYGKALWSYRLPYRWWTWKVLTRSKKLVWKDKTMWCWKKL